MTKDEALQMCLEYIETDAHERKYVRHAIKEALAQPAQALDKFFEIENELGLHYDEKPTQDGNVCARCGGIVFDPVLEEPAQEPVAWMHEWDDGDRIALLHGADDRNDDKPISIRPLVFGDTASPQRPWVGLTNEEIDLIVKKLFDSKHHTFNAFPRAIEAKLKEKNV
jgi:hypothetical protein